MACHELAALRIGLMNVVGIKDEAERQHELAEIGAAATELGPINALLNARDFASLRSLYDSALSGLEAKVARLAADDASLPYYRSLMILTKKVELDLRMQEDNLKRLYADLEEMHDFVHEVYPKD